MKTGKVNTDNLDDSSNKKLKYLIEQTKNKSKALKKILEGLEKMNDKQERNINK